MSRRANEKILVNRAPVLTLWAAVVAERLGFDWDEALSLGKALAGLNAQAKGQRLGIFAPRAPSDVERARAETERKKRLTVALMGRLIPVTHTPDGLRALAKERPITPESVERYLRSKFSDHYETVLAAMRELAEAFEPEELAEVAFSLYEQFRPEVPEGVRGWGAKGELRLDRIRGLAKQA